jgi:hypothetical protein
VARGAFFNLNSARPRLQARPVVDPRRPVRY